MPQLTIKTAWVEELKALGCYDKWFFNVKNSRPKSKWGRFDTEWIEDSISFKEFLGRSFVFIETPEGEDFWCDIHKKY